MLINDHMPSINIKKENWIRLAVNTSDVVGTGIRFGKAPSV